MRKRRVAVTGGVACGKSTVCRIFQDLGAEVISADQIVHQLLANDPIVQLEVVRLLGESVLSEGKLSKELIAKAVFLKGSSKSLRALEKILHPRVYARIDELYEKSSAPLFVAEIPLLFETKEETKYDAVVVVAADRERSKERASTRADREIFQLPLSEKIKKGTFTIYNNGTLEELREQVEQVYQNLQGE